MSIAVMESTAIILTRWPPQIRLLASVRMILLEVFHGQHRTPACAIESISEDLHQEDSYYQPARAIDAKIVILMANDMAFHSILLLGLAPH